MENRTGPGLAARIEALLPQVSKPARYLGSEIGVRRKEWPADPGAGVATDLDAKTVSLTTSLDAATVQAALQRAGFTATPV